MKKALISFTAGIFTVLALSVPSFATGNGIVEGAVEGARDVTEGVVEGAESVVEGAGNTAENILTPGPDNAADDTVNDTVTRRDILADTNPAGANPATGMSTIPFAMTVGGVGAAAIAALAGRKR